MAIQHSIQVKEQAYIDPGDVRGPWTVMFPLLRDGTNPIQNGDWFYFIALTLDTTTVKFDGNGKKIEIPGETTATSFTFDVKGGAFKWQFNSARDSGNGTWSIVSSFIPTEIFP